MPEITVEEETLERLDALKKEGESYDELVEELCNIYEAEASTIHTPDEID